MALAIATFAYGVVLVRLTRTIDHWFGAARRAAEALRDEINEALRSGATAAR